VYILGIETATDVGSVAIIEDEILRGEIRINKKFAQSRNLVQSIDFLLRSLELQGKDLNGIAISIGPGSYTGLRVGLSVAKSLAYSWEKPLVAANSLDSLARLGICQNKLICSLIRFRRNEYYYAFFNGKGYDIERQGEYDVGTLQKICGELDESTVFCGILNPDDRNFFDLESEDVKFDFLSKNYPSAYWVAYLGMKNLLKGFVEDLNQLVPFYMHDFPI